MSLTPGIVLLRKRLARFDAGIQLAGNDQCKTMLVKIGIKLGKRRTIVRHCDFHQLHDFIIWYKRHTLDVIEHDQLTL